MGVRSQAHTPCVAVCCGVLRCYCCSVLQCVAVCRGVIVAVCCSLIRGKRPVEHGNRSLPKRRRTWNARQWNKCNMWVRWKETQHCNTNSATHSTTNITTYYEGATSPVQRDTESLRLVGSQKEPTKRDSLFCKRAQQKRLYSAKDTYHFKEPTNRMGWLRLVDFWKL